MLPPARRSQSGHRSSCTLGLAGTLEEQQRVKQKPPERNGMFTAEAHLKGLTVKNFSNIFYQPYVKPDGHITVFLCYRVFSTFTLRAALPFRTPLVPDMWEQSVSAARCSLPVTPAGPGAEPPAPPCSWPATTRLCRPSACMSSSLACRISAGNKTRNKILMF